MESKDSIHSPWTPYGIHGLHTVSMDIRSPWAPYEVHGFNTESMNSKSMNSIRSPCLFHRLRMECMDPIWSSRNPWTLESMDSMWIQWTPSGVHGLHVESMDAMWSPWTQYGVHGINTESKASTWSAWTPYGVHGLGLESTDSIWRSMDSIWNILLFKITFQRGGVTEWTRNHRGCPHLK